MTSTEAGPPRPRTVAPVALSALAAAHGLEGEPRDVAVTGVTHASGEVRPGDLFAALPGARVHGARFAADAVERGAAAVLTDPDGAEQLQTLPVPVLVTPDPRGVLGVIARDIYRTAQHAPVILGVTGTNGKTSTAFVAEALLRNLGQTTGLSTTAERHIGERTIVTKLTTPEASELHALVATMAEAGVETALIEISAQAVERHRVDGLRCQVVGFTNLSHDHLDDYGDMETYFAFKRELFTPERAELGVVCVDTEWGERLAAEAEVPVVTVATEGAEATWSARDITATDSHTEFTLTGPAGSARLRIPFFGRFMVQNAAVAIVMLLEAGHTLESLETAAGAGIRDAIPGRLQRVSGERGPAVFVDYGHSPDAFEQALKAVGSLPGRSPLVMVFGADGDRDRTKRADMGRISATLADHVVVTDYNPRFEDPAAIRREVIAGIESVPDASFVEAVPEEFAIRVAIDLAGERGAVVWCGPGEAEYREVQGVDEPFSAVDEARLALRDAGWLS